MKSRLSIVLCILLAGAVGCISRLSPEELAHIEQNQTFWTWERKDAPDLRVHYEEAGSGDRHVMLLHGLSSRTTTWEDVVPALVDAGYHTWAIDLIGFGLSDKPADVEYGLDLFAAQVIAFMDAHEIPTAHFVGNSMGGGLTLAMGYQHPDRVRSLTPVDPACYGFETPFTVDLMRFVGPDVAEALASRMMIVNALEQVFYDDSKVTERKIEQYMLPHRTPGGTAAVARTAASRDLEQMEEWSKHIPEIEAPTLVVWGEQDEWIPVELAWRLGNDIAGAEVRVFDRCGHLPQEEIPDRFNPLLVEFLDKVEAARQAEPPAEENEEQTMEE